MRHLLAFAALLALPVAGHAQGASIAPGMSRAQVVAAFGEPVNARAANEFTYMFYRNDCGKTCGMNDLVILRRDSVVDAVLRSPSRRYTGTSSSPEALSREGARVRPAASTGTVAVPATTTAAAPPKASSDSARKLIASNPALVDQLQRRLLGSGLTSTQIRARLRAEGYPENLLDEYMRSAAARSQAPASSMKPGSPKDTRPSVPAAQPPVKPAATTTTTTKPPTT